MSIALQLSSRQSAVRRRRARSRGAGRRKGRQSKRLSVQPAADAAEYGSGYGVGYRDGVQAGIQRFGGLFEGTSIVIPTYNQLPLLQQCIESISACTRLPHEIIVVDNGSADGTAAYLQSLGGRVRSRVLDSNRGFAGAINVGMLMAKGTTIVLLNNDTLVTDNWLDNMLACLSSDEKIGMVGPVTNYISGEQQIAVPYSAVKDMPGFARSYNLHDPARWRRTDRLVGFCLLFRRELFEGVGYFDEGFLTGNFEDDDFGVRVRLLGKSLVIAEDTFIHHYGSISMKALGEQFMVVNNRNESYFSDKWHSPEEWIFKVLQHPLAQGRTLPGSAWLYPERVAVQGFGPHVYWIEGGQRRRIEGVVGLPVTRVSQVDLRRWPVGDIIAVEEAERRWRGADNEWQAGVVMLPDGAAYHVEGHHIRRIVTPSALFLWNLNAKPCQMTTPESLAGKMEGLPIIAPPQIRYSL
ncbi:glycosyltransferase family 2 protein [Cohnella faecalis]|uniref:glycosyltransferase family 2 protein n=1 Tax=Cohnella faecalis TaxID=2315694 RepID=UPI003620F260